MTKAKQKKLYKRYLRLIGIKTIPTGIDGLREIIHKHLYYVPFENVSKLILFGKERSGRPLSLSEFLDGIEFHDLGGTCHSSNPYLQELLNFLGFETMLLGADMSESNVHTCLRTILNSHQYHVDVGYAAPFKEPMRLDNTPHTIVHGKYTYQFKKSENLNKYKIEVLLDGNRIHGYSINEDVRNFNFFVKTIKESFEPGNTFMSCIRITRVFKDRTIELKDNKLIYYKGAKSYSKMLMNMAEVETTVKNELMMPRCPVKKAIKILEQVTQHSFFEEKKYPVEY
jgi:arylamine N-acetyltransferase